MQRFAGYERRSLEIEDRVDDVADFAYAPQRVEGLEPLVGRGVVGGCLDNAERDRVDSDAARGVFDRKRTAGPTSPPLVRAGSADGRVLSALSTRLVETFTTCPLPRSTMSAIASWVMSKNP